jgi:rhodanese-related sulfurtransferase
MAVKNLMPEQVQQLLKENNDIVLLDVREKWEFEICNIDSSINIPMNEVPAVVKNLATDSETIVICHHGARSMQVAYYLENAGFSDIINLDGGLDAWARMVDPTMPQY